MECINVGIIGFGMSGRTFHAPFINILPQFCLYKISTTNKESIAVINQSYPQASIVDNPVEILNDDKVDLVIVAASNNVHYALAKEALKKNKHVVVEKPFTITTAEADELIQLAKERACILTIYQNRRWDSDFKTVRKLISSGLLGNIVEYNAAFDRFRPELKQNAWREKKGAGAGILYDLGPHLIDQTLQLFGMPLEVTATLLCQRPDAKVDDYFSIRLLYDDLVVNLHAGMLVKTPTPRFALYGNKGSFVKYGLDVQEGDLKKGKQPSLDSSWGKEPKDIWGRLVTEVNGVGIDTVVESETGNYAGFYINLYNTIVGNEEIAVSPIEARNVIYIIEMAIKSYVEKRIITL